MSRKKKRKERKKKKEREKQKNKKGINKKRRRERKSRKKKINFQTKYAKRHFIYFHLCQVKMEQEFRCRCCAYLFIF